jgi:hypothetical protein
MKNDSRQKTVTLAMMMATPTATTPTKATPKTLINRKEEENRHKTNL